MTTDNIITSSVEEVLEDNTSAYANAILKRSIPSVYDGQKPVSRRIIYSSFKNGLTHKKPYKKGLAMVGFCSPYHPHGDLAIFDTSMRMTQSWGFNIPFVDGSGNIGSTNKNNDWAASRYVEVRLAKTTEMMTDGLSEEEIEILDETLTYRELLENNGIELEESTIVVDSISRYDEDYEIFVKDDSLDDLAQ